MTEFTSWSKSSYSAGDSPNCVMNRKAVSDGVVAQVQVGDSKDPAFATNPVTIPVSPAAWSAFVETVKG